MLKVLFVFGTRPEAIKMAPVIQAMALRQTEFIPRVCVTAQHRQLLDSVLDLFGIVPDYDLKVMEMDQSPTQVWAAVLSRLEPVLLEFRPDWVLVQGDTTSTAAAALAAFHAGTKVAHVEAGLRTGDKSQPFPEEINRRLATLLADLHFAPTESSRRNLLREGTPEDRIQLTGNSGIDAFRWALQRPPSPEITSLLERLDLISANQGTRAGSAVKLILVTAHRRENFGQPLENICRALQRIASDYSGRVQIVFLVHHNPNVIKVVRRILCDGSGITLLDPIDYVSMAYLLNKSDLVVTDSGGLQEEATSLGKPILVIRGITDRPESVQAGTALIVGVETEAIVKHVSRLIEDASAYEAMAQAAGVYGDGHASQKIVDSLLSFR